VKVRSEEYAALVHNVKSLIRRGVVVKIALPLAAAGFMVYGLVATPLVRTLVRHVRGAPAAVAPARTLDLQPVEAETADPAAATTPAEVSKDAAVEVGGEGVAHDLAAAAGVVAEEPPAAAPAEAPAVVVPASLEKAASVAVAEGGAPPSAASEAQAAQPPAASGAQTLEIVVSEPVRIKLDVDGGPPVTKELTPDTYKFTFTDHADMMVYDAGAVKISFNGRSLGSLGNKGRVRRLSFQAQAPDAKKL
jgi:hypothetical protein